MHMPSILYIAGPTGWSLKLYDGVGGVLLVLN